MQAAPKRNTSNASVGRSLGDPGFAHLHLHTQYSLLDGAIRMDELAPAIKERGMDSVAVTDHGNMFGAVHFYQQAKKHGVKPILGCEAYVAGPKGREDRTDRTASHLVLLAKDNEGYKNLSHMISMGYMEGFYYKPRIDRELLKKHSKGIYALSACLGGVVNRCFLKEGEAKAAEAAREFADLFEPGHFFLELQDNGIDLQYRANDALMNISELSGIPLVATADAHYLNPEHAAAHEVLMCIGQGYSLEEFRSKSFKHSDKTYVRTPEEMWAYFSRVAPSAMENTVRIARECKVELDLESRYLPNFEVPEGESRESYLEKLTLEGLKQRIKEAHYPIDEGAYKERLDYELSVINKMGFAGYFLIVWDFIRYSKDHGIPVGPGRGSGAGSIVAWSLRITDLDPIPYDLIFERFLNPERVSMPDFDIDFCQNRRGEVIDYVSERYGKKNVGQIVTYSALSAKSVIKDVGRVMGLPFGEVNELTKLIPGLVNGKKVTLDQALQIEPKLREIQKEKPIYEQVIQIGRSLEGMNRQTGIHAAGVVIGDHPIWDYVPVCRGKDGEIVTQFAKDEVELAGLIKFDFLGLKTLTVIANAQGHVRQRDDDGPLGPNRELDTSLLPLDDPEVYKLMSAADTDGVFQLESSGFKELLKRLKPDCFEDVVAAVALYRPGPLDAGMVDDYISRKHGKTKITYPHPVCEPILNTTYGVIVYQEQVMRIAVDLCGFSMGQADVLRKAMGKKKAEVMAKMRAKFVEGAHQTNGMDHREADELFTQIEKFAGYAFNKSHSAAYAVISYQTGFLKRYYPVEFMAALLSTEMGVQDNVVKYIQSAREKGIRILPPDVLRSERDFSVTLTDDGERCILFGLGAVKGMGDSAIDAILESRKQGTPPSLFQFCEQVDTKKVSRKVLEVLCKSGALDCFNRPRAQLYHTIERALEAGQRAQRDRASGQTSLFAAFSSAKGEGHHVDEVYPDTSEWSEKQRLAFEKQSLGFYITGHPLDRYTDVIPRLCSANTQSLASFAAKGNFRSQEVSLGGVVSAYRERPYKSGNGRMAFITIEDLHGTCEVLVFAKVYEACEELIKGDDPLWVQGTVQVEGDDNIKMRASQIERLADARGRSTKNIDIEVPVYELNEDRLVQLKEILTQCRGSVPAKLTIVNPEVSETVIALPEYLRVNPSDELLSRVDGLFGRPVVRLS